MACIAYDQTYPLFSRGRLSGRVRLLAKWQRRISVRYEPWFVTYILGILTWRRAVLSVLTVEDNLKMIVMRRNGQIPGNKMYEPLGVVWVERDIIANKLRSLTSVFRSDPNKWWPLCSWPPRWSRTWTTKFGMAERTLKALTSTIYSSRILSSHARRSIRQQLPVCRNLCRNFWIADKFCWVAQESTMNITDIKISCFSKQCFDMVHGPLFLCLSTSRVFCEVWFLCHLASCLRGLLWLLFDGAGSRPPGERYEHNLDLDVAYIPELPVRCNECGLHNALAFSRAVVFLRPLGLFFSPHTTRTRQAKLYWAH